jgi:hypothetical protein
MGDQFASAPPPGALRPSEEEGPLAAPRPKPAEPRRGTNPFRRWLRRLFGGGPPDSDRSSDADAGHGGRGQGDGHPRASGGPGGGRKGSAAGAGAGRADDGGDREDAEDGSDTSPPNGNVPLVRGHLAFRGEAPR